MTRKCIAIEDLPRVAQRPDSDRERRHLDSCPRCRALLASSRAFLEAPELPESAGLPAAEDRLGAFIDREIASSAGPAGSRARGVNRPVRFRDRLIRWLEPHPVRYALVGATAVALFFLIRSGGELPSAPAREPILRGSESALRIRAEARLAPDGRLQVHWSPLAAADGYVLVLLGADLTERVRLEAGMDTAITADPARLTVSQGGAAPLFFKVTALRGGDLLASSPTQPLPLR